MHLSSYADSRSAVGVLFAKTGDRPARLPQTAAPSQSAGEAKHTGLIGRSDKLLQIAEVG